MAETGEKLKRRTQCKLRENSKRNISLSREIPMDIVDNSTVSRINLSKFCNIQIDLAVLLCAGNKIRSDWFALGSLWILSSSSPIRQEAIYYNHIRILRSFCLFHPEQIETKHCSPLTPPEFRVWTAALWHWSRVARFESYKSPSCFSFTDSFPPILPSADSLFRRFSFIDFLSFYFLSLSYQRSSHAIGQIVWPVCRSLISIQ